MANNFDLKSQKILGSLEPKGGVWSIPFEHEPDDANLLETRGHFYIVVDFKAEPNVDLHLASKIIIDAVKEHYYGDLDGTPLQALESAIIYGKEKLQQAAKVNESSNINFDIVAGVVWGSVLYVAHSGDTSCLIIRNGEVTNISHKTSGEVMTSSGILENEDVVIFATKAFEGEFNNDQLVTNLGNLEYLFSNSPNSASLSAVIVRFKKSMLPGKKDLAKFAFGFGKNKTQNANPVAQKQPAPANDPTSNITSLNSNGENASTSTEKKESFATNEPKQKFELKPQKKGRKRKQLFSALALLLVFSFVGFGAYSFYKNSTNKPQREVDILTNTTLNDKYSNLGDNASLSEYKQLASEVEEAINNGGDYSSLLSELNKKIASLEDTSDNVYFDFSIKQNDSNVNKLTLYNGGIFVSDGGANAAYIVTEEEGEMAIEDIAGGDNFLIAGSFDNTLYIIENQKVLQGTSVSSLQEYQINEELQNVNDFYVYFGNIYLAEGDQIVKLELTGDTYTKTTWASTDFAPKTLAVDGSIYVAGSEFAEYYTGDNQNTTLGEGVNFSNGLIYTTVNSNNMYLVTNNTYYNLQKPSFTVNSEVNFEGSVTNPNTFVVNEDTLYLTKNSRMYKIALNEEE